VRAIDLVKPSKWVRAMWYVKPMKAVRARRDVKPIDDVRAMYAVFGGTLCCYQRREKFGMKQLEEQQG